MLNKLLLSTIGGILILGLIGTVQAAWGAGTLYVGSDVEEFQGLPDKIGKYPTQGGTVVDGGNIFLSGSDNANGLTIVGNQLLSGTVFVSDLKFRNLIDPSTVLNTFDADTPDFEFNEDLAFDGTSVWRAHFLSETSGSIRELDPNNLGGAALSVHNLNFGPVGMTVVDGVLWISDWGGDSYGTFDPTSDTYIPMIFTGGPNAGCLAFDGSTRVLWTGQQGGVVRPYNVDTLTPINDGFMPFGVIGATIDGCAFLISTLIGGEIIPIDSTALLLAGAQMNAAWMIPVIVSAIGIGIVIARKF